jgi:hypothetical protein
VGCVPSALPARISPRSNSSLLESPVPSPFLICAVRRCRWSRPFRNTRRSRALSRPSTPYSAWRAWVRGLNGADRGPEHPLHNGAAGTEVPPREHCIAVRVVLLHNTRQTAQNHGPRWREHGSPVPRTKASPHNLRRRARPTSVSGEKWVIAILHDIPESACASAYFQRIALRWE